MIVLNQSLFWKHKFSFFFTSFELVTPDKFSTRATDKCNGQRLPSLQKNFMELPWRLDP